MFQTDLMAGQRILVTGGGTGLGRAMAERFLRWAPTSRSAAAGKASAMRRRPTGAASFRSAASTPSASTSAIAQAVDEMVEASGSRAADGARQQRGRQLHRSDRRPVAARLRRDRQHRLPRQLLRHAGGRQALDGRGQGRPVEGRRPVSQRDEHHRHLGRQRLALRRAVGDEQGRHRRDDQVARGRVGPVRHPPQRGRAGRDSDRRHEQAAEPRRGARRAQQGAQPDGRAGHDERAAEPRRLS